MKYGTWTSLKWTNMEQQNQSIDKSKHMLTVFAPIGIILFVQYILSMVIMQLVMVYDLANYNSENFEEFMIKYMSDCSHSSVNTALSIAYAITCISLFGWWYITHEVDAEKIKHPLNNIASNIPLMAAGIVLTAIALQYVCIYLMNALGMMFPSWVEEYEQLFESAGIGDNLTIGFIIYGVILGPVCEELAFRGITFKAARRAMPTVWAIITQALLFSALHMNKLQCSYTFIVGLILGYVMYRYDSLIITTIMHIIFNFIGSIGADYLYVGGATPATFFIWFLTSMIVTYLGITLLDKAAPAKTED